MFADSMDAFKVAEEWPDGLVTETRLFPVDGRINAYDMDACYNVDNFAPEPGCPAEPRCFLGPAKGPWVSNCGNRVEAASDMLAMTCAPIRRPACERVDEPVLFRGHARTGRSVFMGHIRGAGCYGNWNWICFGANTRGEGCLSTDERRGWSPAIIDWTGARLVAPPENRYSPPGREFDLRVTILDYITSNAGELGLSHLLRPDNDQMGTIDLWEASHETDGCEAHRVIATLPGAHLLGSGDPVSADLVLVRATASMSLLMRHEEYWDAQSSSRAVKTGERYYVTVQLGLDIETSVRVNGNLCGTPPVIDGQRVAFTDVEGFYRPPYAVQWQAEATPDSESPWFDLTDQVLGAVVGRLRFPNLSNIGICRSYRTGMAGRRVESKSVAKGGGEIEFWDGSAKIERIG